MTNLALDLVATARRHPERLALRRDEVEIPYRALDAAGARLAGLLVERGLRPGEPVDLLLPDVPYLAIAVYGVLRAGGIVVPRDEASPAPDPGPTALVWHAAAQASAPRRLVVAPGGFEECLAATAPLLGPVPRAGTDPAFAGDGGARTHAEVRREADRVARSSRLGPGHDLLCAPPLTRAEAITALHAAILAGACLTLPTGLSADGLVERSKTAVAVSEPAPLP